MKKLRLFFSSCMVIMLALFLVGCNQSQLDSRIVWRYTLSDSTYTYYGSAAFSSDEQTIYFGTSLKVALPQSADDKLIALNKNGSLKWEYNTSGGEVRSNPIVYNSNIYFIADYGRTEAGANRSKAELHALNNNGQLLWKQQIASSGAVAGGLYDLVANQNKIIVVTHCLFAFDYLTGQSLFQSEVLQQTSGVVSYPRPVLHNNKTYFFLNQAIYQFDGQTNSLSHTTIVGLPQNFYNAPVQGALRFDTNNNAYFGYNSYYISLNPNMSVRWIYDIQDADHNFRSTACLDQTSQTLYVGTKANEKSKFIALNMSSGALVWSYNIGSDVYSSPTIKNDLVFFGSETRKLHAMRTSGTMAYEVDLGYDVTWMSPKIDSQGVLYIGCMGKYFYAIQT